MSSNNDAGAALRKAATDEALAILDRMPLAFLTRESLVQDLLEIAFMRGSLYGQTIAQQKIWLALSDTGGKPQ
jgi:hypothetical protein